MAEHAVQQEHDRLVHILDGGLPDRLAVVVDAPRSEVLERGERGAAQRARTVGHYADLIAAEDQGQLAHVGHELGMCLLERAAVGCGFFQLDEP